MTKEEKVDQLDLDILKELRQDGRQSYRKLAGKLNVATGTVQARIKRMEDSGIITGYHAGINFAKIGFNITAIIGVMGKQDVMRDLEQKLAKNKNVYGVYMVTGEYDILIAVKFKEIHDLNDFIRENFTKEGIDKTVTFLVLETFKEKRGLFE